MWSIYSSSLGQFSCELIAPNKDLNTYFLFLLCEYWLYYFCFVFFSQLLLVDLFSYSRTAAFAQKTLMKLWKAELFESPVKELPL